MPRLIVRLPENRAVTGSLVLEGDDASLLAGPFEVCGRADGHTAALHRNVARNPLLPYGDTPLGLYRVAGVVDCGEESGFPADAFGPHGVVVLAPVAGDAALADANGRFQVLIQGGPPGPGGGLRTTNGSLRLADRDQAELVRHLRLADPVACSCEAGDPDASIASPRGVATDVPCEDGDPVRALFTISGRREPVLGAARGGHAVGNGETPSATRPGRRRFSPPVFRLFSTGEGGGGGGGGGAGGYGGVDDDQNSPPEEDPASPEQSVYHYGSDQGNPPSGPPNANPYTGQGVNSGNSNPYGAAQAAGALPARTPFSSRTVPSPPAR